MSDHHLQKRALLSIPPSEWRKSVVGQRMTWLKKSGTDRRGYQLVAQGLSGCGPRDPSTGLLQTLKDMASNRIQWRTCCQFLAGMS